MLNEILQMIARYLLQNEGRFKKKTLGKKSTKICLTASKVKTMFGCLAPAVICSVELHTVLRELDSEHSVHLKPPPLRACLNQPNAAVFNVRFKS